MKITTWQRVLIIAVFVTIIFALLLCFAAGSDPALGLEAANDVETPYPAAGASHDGGALSGTADPIHDRVLIEPTPTPDPDEYEPDDAKHQASPITVGNPQHHNFQRLDEDWVKFWAWGGNSYTIRTFDLDYGCNTVLCLYDAPGTQMECDNDGGDELASRIAWTPDESGIYFVSVSQYEPSVSGNLNYSLDITEVVRCRDRFEPDDTYENAKPITEDPHTFHGPCGGDVDWASFQAVGGQVYAIWTSDQRGNNDTVLGLYDAARQKLAENDDSAEDIPASRLVWQAPADGTGTYLVKVSPFEPTVGGCDLEYTLHVDTLAAMPSPAPTPTPPHYEPDEYEPDDAMHQANRIVVHSGVPQDHAFHSYHDQDWVKFWAWTGYTYTIKTEVGPGTATELDLYKPDGQRLPVEDDGGGESAASRIEWKATETGSYFVRVTYSGISSSSNRGLASPYGLTYALTISETIPCREEEYEPDNSQGQAKWVIVGGDPQHRCFYVPCYDGYHPADTVDWVKFEARAGITYTIRTFDLTSSTDTTLQLHDAYRRPVTVNGNEVVNDDYADDSLASKIIWQATADGTYYVKVSPFDPRVGGCDVCYSLRVTRPLSYVYLPLVLKPPPNIPPYRPSDPLPTAGAMDQPLDVELSWSGGDANEDDDVFYDIYLGTKSPPPHRETIGPFPASQTFIAHEVGPLRGGMLYHWYVEAHDDHGGASRGPKEGWWDFTTCACPDECEPDNDLDEANPLEPAEPVTGYICQEHLESGDGEERDWYYFEIDKLRDIEVDLEVPDTVNYDLFLWVGYWLGSEDPTPGADEHISWSATGIGTYYVVVKSLGDYDNCSPYRLQLGLR
jgi:hypothetical protein